MTVVHADAVTFEDRVHFADDGCAAGFDAVEGEHGGYVVREDLVRVDNGLIVAHGR